MEKMKQNISVKLPPLNLYLNDLVDLDELLQEHFNETDVRTKEYKYNSIGEFIENKKDLTNEITIYDGFSFEFIIRLGGYRNTIDHENDIKMIGIATKVASILKKRKRKFGYEIRLIMSSIVVFIVYVLIHTLFGHSAELDPFWFVIVIGALLFYRWIDRFRCLKIYRYNFDDKPSFFKRNKDKLIVGAITLLVGAGLGFFVQYLVKRYL